MLTDTFVYSLSFPFALPLLFRSVLSTEQLEKVILLSKEIYVGDCILLTKNTQKIFCLLLLCGISELQDNKYTMITERIRNIFVYDKNLHARKIFHKTVEMYLKYTNRYTHARTHAHTRTHTHTHIYAVWQDNFSSTSKHRIKYITERTIDKNTENY